MDHSNLLATLTEHSGLLSNLLNTFVSALLGYRLGIAQADRSHARAAMAEARAGIKRLIENPSRLLYERLPVDTLDEFMDSQWAFNRHRLRQAIARCETASQQRHQDAAGQTHLSDANEAKRALEALLRLLG